MEALVERTYSFSAESLCTGILSTQRRGDYVCRIQVLVFKSRDGSFDLSRSKSLRQRNNGADHVADPLFVMDSFFVQIHQFVHFYAVYSRSSLGY
jgi:hypothetical protein